MIYQFTSARQSLSLNSALSSACHDTFPHTEFYISIINFIKDFVSRTCYIDIIIELILHIAQHIQ